MPQEKRSWEGSRGSGNGGGVKILQLVQIFVVLGTQYGMAHSIWNGKVFYCGGLILDLCLSVP